MDPRRREAPRSTEDPPPTPTQRGARAYAGAVEAVLSILVGAGLGWWGDAELGTGPWLLVIGLGFGFAAFVHRLARLRRMVEAEAAEAAAAEAEAAEAEAAEAARREESD